MKRKVIRIFTFVMSIVLFISCPLSVYASEKWEGSLGLTLYYNKDKILQYIKDTGEFWLYGVSQMGAIVKSDFVQFAENKKKMDDILAEGSNIGVYVNENDEMKGLYFSKEFMTQLKALLDEYAKQYEPYTMYKTIPLNRISNMAFGEQKNAYDSLKNLLADSPSGVIGVSYYRMNGTFRFTDIGSHFKDVGFVNHYYDGYKYKAEIKAYEIETWKHATYPRYELVLSPDDAAIKNKDDFISRAETTYSAYSEYIRFYCLSADATMEKLYNDINCLHTGNQVSNVLLSNDSRRLRVYNTYADFQDYTIGKRKVYYTSNYYNYVPEDLSVSIDDLQKEIDDLSKVIDELLKQIQKDTDENEIEELLRQILEELRKNPGGGGSGGGDVTVNIDMKETNSWLSKIYNKVCEIYAKMNSTVEDAEDAALAKIQESLDEIIVQLKKIKRWAAVDTVINGVDAIADWLDLIHDVINDADDGAESAVSTLADALTDSGDMLKAKFPFSIPWDILMFVTLFAAEPQVPYFEIPIDIEMDWMDINIHYGFVIDFSQFQWLSDLSRLVLSMTYAVGLMKLTMNISLLKKED